MNDCAFDVTPYANHIPSIILVQSLIKRHLAKRELSKRSSMVKKRRNVSNEILTTERDYVKNLRILVQSFLKPLVENTKQLEAQLIKELALLLSGVEFILTLHHTLLTDLEENLQHWKPSTKLGDLFSQMAMYLKTYYQYVNHYQYVVQWLAKRKGDKVLQKILDGLKPEATGKGIKDFMIMPIQRIPRYKLFLVELIKCTWKSHIDYDNLVEANKKIQDVAVAIENQSADALSIAKVMELAGSFKSKGESFKLVVPHRRYIADTDATLLPDNITQTSAMTLRVFLFNDLILWGKPKKDKFSIKHKLEINKIKVIEFPTTQSPNSRLSNDLAKRRTIGVFEIESQEDKVIRMIISENSDKWANYLQVCRNGGKVWLPHDIVEDNAKIITVKQSSPPNVRKKSRLKTFFSSLSRENEFQYKEDGANSPSKDSSPLTASSEMGLSSKSTQIPAIRSHSFDPVDENSTILQSDSNNAECLRTHFQSRRKRSSSTGVEGTQLNSLNAELHAFSNEKNEEECNNGAPGNLLTGSGSIKKKRDRKKKIRTIGRSSHGIASFREQVEAEGKQQSTPCLSVYSIPTDIPRVPDTISARTEGDFDKRKKKRILLDNNTFESSVTLKAIKQSQSSGSSDNLPLPENNQYKLHSASENDKKPKKRKSLRLSSASDLRKKTGPIVAVTRKKNENSIESDENTEDQKGGNHETGQFVDSNITELTVGDAQHN